MKRFYWALGFMVVLVGLSIALGRTPLAQSLQCVTVSGFTAEEQAEIQRLRDLGPEGLATILAKYEHEFASGAGDDSTATLEAYTQKLQKLQAQIDQVAGQRDATSSRLYWYTDFDKALAAAQVQNKPVLSLRLLGNLTDEYSCANSRFFRATLYPNAQVSAFLRDNYILHWQSVRPVPKVSIDFGDGRRMNCTITGNSIHYVLDSQGRITDGIPGLYGPQAFLARLQQALPVAQELSRLDAESYAAQLKEYHANRAKEVFSAWHDEVVDIVRAETQGCRAVVTEPQRVVPETAAELEQFLTDSDWNILANRHLGEVQFDTASQRVIARMYPAAEQAAVRAVTKMRLESPLLRLIRKLTDSIALDMVKNEYLYHRQLHERLAVEPCDGDVGLLNEWVYAALFLTPLSDPWMGLSDADVFTALEEGGRVQ